MRPLPLCLVVVIALLAVILQSSSLIGAQAEPPGYAQLKAEAEQLYSEGSYAKSHELYQRADALELSAGEARWIDFRLADTMWRSQAATQTNDTTIFDRAQQQLQGLIARIEREEDRDLVWAEAQESLGDFWWARQNSQNWGAGWNQYQLALEWWAAS